MTKKDEIINNLILITCKEVDYWLLEENKMDRENEYGPHVYKEMVSRFTYLRNKLLKIILTLPGAGVEKKKKCLYNKKYENNIQS